MTPEEKDLLLKDLCTRLPYGVKLDNGLKLRSIDMLTEVVSCSGSDKKVENVRPYLRPMLSMTEEELDELLDGENSDFDDKSGLVKKAMLAWAKGDNLLSNALFSMQYAKTIDWLNAHHFDYRGLIEKGLALEVSEGMYKTE